MKEFHLFEKDISKIPQPKSFTFPFYYEPHELSLMAIEQTQNELKEVDINEHNFGLSEKESHLPSIGKMIGVLVVKNEIGQIGFLKAYSGKLQKNDILPNYAPAITDGTLSQDFINKTKQQVERFNKDIIKKENHTLLTELKESYINKSREFDELIHQAKIQYADGKKKRIKYREESILNTDEKLKLFSNLAKESSQQKRRIKEIKMNKRRELVSISLKIQTHEQVITSLKEQRRKVLANLQQRQENQLTFCNIESQSLGLQEIFKQYHNKKPNVGTGECCAPKLLNFAFKNKLYPLALAEFWWGAPHKNNIRRHKNIYPACTGRCAPLLKHMLKGIPMEPDPIKVNWGQGKEIETLFEDEFLLVINKPAGLLTTPGRFINDSVQTRIQNLYPTQEYIMPIHRLDQGTSGIVIIAKSTKIHKLLQRQFINKTIQKRYSAILDGTPNKTEGEIAIPLSLDPNNPPFQMIDLKSKKNALTRYEVIREGKETCLVYFYPITGRTHQLRVHSAHQRGLDAPIKGDDMYGVKSDRMYLHADRVTFVHPLSKEKIIIECPAKFDLI